MPESGSPPVRLAERTPLAISAIMAPRTTRREPKEGPLGSVTARRELLELVDKNYLPFELRGKAFVFSSSRGLQEMFH
jgi:hypothetical protein